MHVAPVTLRTAGESWGEQGYIRMRMTGDMWGPSGLYDVSAGGFYFKTVCIATGRGFKILGTCALQGREWQAVMKARLVQRVRCGDTRYTRGPASSTSVHE